MERNLLLGIEGVSLRTEIFPVAFSIIDNYPFTNRKDKWEKKKLNKIQHFHVVAFLYSGERRDKSILLPALRSSICSFSSIPCFSHQPEVLLTIMIISYIESPCSGNVEGISSALLQRAALPQKSTISDCTLFLVDCYKHSLQRILA